MEDVETKDNANTATTKRGDAQQARREIPGGLPYLAASGTLKRMLDKIIEAERPDRFTYDFIENVLKMTGGSARACISVLKKMGFLTTDGTPTDLYAKFKTDSGRPHAALQGLKNAFSEIFRRSEYAHQADENKLKDIIVEITGLQKGDQVATAIRSTFKVIRDFIPPNFSATSDSTPTPIKTEFETPPLSGAAGSERTEAGGINLAYNINIVLPSTSDLTVLNAIFRSLKENLLR